MLPRPSQGHCLCSLKVGEQNKFVILGGEDGQTAGTAYGFVEMYDFAEDTWTPLPDLPVALSHGACSPFVKDNDDHIIVYYGNHLS